MIGLTGDGILERKGCLSFALSDAPEEERKGRIENSAIADRGIRSIVARPAQGDDRPIANIIDISPCPFGPLKKLVLPISDSLNNALLASADGATGDVAPKL